jgi:membrane associated rhomboid family serine protease
MAKDEGGGTGPQGGAPGGRQPVFNIPPSIAAVAGLLIAIHLAATLVLNQQGLGQLVFWFGFIPLRGLLADRFVGGALPLLWTPLTHALLHAGWEHVLLNTAWFVVFATPVARRYGGAAMLILFVLCAIAGAGAFAITSVLEFNAMTLAEGLPPGQVLVGASGAVAGLTGAAVRFMFQPVVWDRDPATGTARPLGRPLASLADLMRSRQARFFILVWVLINAAVPLIPFFTGEPVDVAWQTHLGGFFAGLLLVPLFERRA